MTHTVFPPITPVFPLIPRLIAPISVSDTLYMTYKDYLMCPDHSQRREHGLKRWEHDYDSYRVPTNNTRVPTDSPAHSTHIGVRYPLYDL